MKHIIKNLIVAMALFCALPTFAADFYWVGGSGSWNDIAHWRTTSGGSSNPSVFPGFVDNVFFDDNSGFTSISKTLTISHPNPACHNISFIGTASTTPPNVVMGNGNTTFLIYGSSIWQSGMTVGIPTIYYKNNNEAKTIKSNGVKTGMEMTAYSPTSVYFEETTSVTLLDAYISGGNLYHQIGVFNTGGFDVTIPYDFYANNTTTNKTINLGASNFYLTGYYSVFNVNSSSVTLNAGTSKIRFTNMNGSSNSSWGLSPFSGQYFNEVIFGKLGVNSGGGGSILDHTGIVKFNKVFFYYSISNIRGNNEFSELNISSNSDIRIAGTQTITSAINIGEECGEYTSLMGGTIALNADVSANIFNTHIKSLNATGATSFIANNSLDAGSNTGITFTTAVGKTLYWVGSNTAVVGNPIYWGDKKNWSATSGGTGGYCVPTPADNVIFDANSGFTNVNKIISTSSAIAFIPAFCHNVTFLGTTVPPTLRGTNLNIYGSSTWQTGMILNVNNIYYRNSNEAKTITSNGVSTGTESPYSTNSNVYFEESSSISLLDDFIVGQDLYLQSGTWNTNNKNVNIKRSFFANNTTTAKTINLGNSNIYLEDQNSIFNTGNSSVTLNAGTSHLHFVKIIVYSSSNGALKVIGFDNQVYNDVSFEDSNFTSELSISGSGKANYRTVTFIGNGNFNSNNQIQNLKLASSRAYTIGYNFTQTITNSLNIGQACGGFATLTGISSGSKLTVLNTVLASNIVVNDVIVKSVNASGGQSITANNSLNDGNNINWNFVTAGSQDLYWVGGAGTWSDKAHWSYTSGGTGGDCVPGPGNNVFFDVNSGFTTGSKNVLIDKTSYCHNITFANSSVVPKLSNSGYQNLNIYGSSEWQSGMANVDIANIYYRNTNEFKTIKSNGVITGQNNGGGNVIFEETSSITLLDNFMAGGTLSHSAGTFDTANFDLTIWRQYFETGSSIFPTTLNLGSSIITMPNPDAIFNTNNANLTLNAGTSTINFTASNAVQASPAYGLVTYAGQQFYDVKFFGTGNLGGTHTGKNIFNKVEFKSDGNVYGENDFSTLILSPTKSYKFPNGPQQSVSTLFSAHTPECDGKYFIDILFLNISAPATATIDVLGVNLRQSSATGGAVFNAINTLNTINNAGWVFTNTPSKIMYWVGGAGNWNDKAHWSETSGGVGGYCVPYVTDNVFIDSGSGLTSSSNQITIDRTSYVHNITIAGSSVPPKLAETTNLELNIYGSTIWQNGMQDIQISYIYYRNSGESKTIQNNGVKIGVLVGTTNMYFEETNAISLVDDIIVNGNLYLNAGTFNTANKKMTFRNDIIANANSILKIINLGSSEIFMEGQVSTFNTNSSSVTLNAGTSQIHFTKTSYASSNTYGIVPFAGQSFYDVSFDSYSTNSAGAIGGTHTGTVSYNKVKFSGNGNLYGDNNIKELSFNAGKVYNLQASKTQTITQNLSLGGTPCLITTVKSNGDGIQANINVQGGPTTFNFSNVKDLNATGNTLNFQAQSTGTNQNNTNINFEPYNPGSFSGFGADWLCHDIDDADAASYTIETTNFYGDNNTLYKWYKLNDANYTNTTVISTASQIDVRNFGSFGTFKVEASYSDGTTLFCTVSDELLITEKTAVPTANSYVCQKTSNTLADINVTSLTGATVNWYDAPLSTTPLSLNTVITNNTTYYVTQTAADCESKQKAVTVIILNCLKNNYVNPGLRMRVSK